MFVFPVVMCGGSGTRLWPASQPSRPKQFIPLLGARSTFQDTLIRLSGLEGAQAPVIVAGAAHLELIEAQLAELGRTATILLEPEARDSAAAMAAAAAWIYAHHPDAVAVVVSADHHIPDHAAFCAEVGKAAHEARQGRIVTLGVQPTLPSTAFGYIRPAAGEAEIVPVASFVEKPDAATAEQYVQLGYLWNSGNFVVGAGVLLAELDRFAPQVAQAARAAVETDATSTGVVALTDAFRTAPKISIDYAVMEKTDRASVLPVNFDWADVGAWDAVWKAAGQDGDGNAASTDVLFLSARNCLVRTPAHVRTALVGVRDLAVVMDGDELLICDLEKSQSVKTAAEHFKAASLAASPAPAGDKARLRAAAESFDRWVQTSALPLWWALGADRVHGGYYEALTDDGAPVLAPKRLRVQARQAFAYATAQALGWAGPGDAAARHAYAFLQRRYRRQDGLFRAVVDVDGSPLNDQAFLYEQAFVLLASASLYKMDPTQELLADAQALKRVIEQLRHPKGGFREAGEHPFQANASMHLLEAALAWHELDPAGGWDRLAAELVGLAMRSFIDPERGCLREFFDEDWRPAQGELGRLVEPGHQFEWAWLLDRWAKQAQDPSVGAAARRLFQIGRVGVDPKRSVAINALNDDLSPRDSTARLWPQTEYLKASLMMASHVGPQPALQALNGLMKYFETPAYGVWRDKLEPNGSFTAEPAPASSFYHIVSAWAEVKAFLAA